MSETIFTKIIRGDIPSYKIYEDGRTLAFLDIQPARYGHVLVITKEPVDVYIDLDDADYSALWAAVKVVAAKLRDEIKTDRIGILVKGTDVPHTHVHLIPFNEGQELAVDEDSPQLSDDEFRQLADKLKINVA